jgi:AP2 domain/HNH endonuclease
MPKQRVVRHAVVQPQDQSYKIIPLTRKQNAIVDTADYEWLMQWNWFANWCPSNKRFYATRRNGSGKLGMARAILQCQPDKEPDHKNHDTLDNRRQNLRTATRSQNMRNVKRCSTNMSGYKGVRWHKSDDKWSADITHKGKRIHLGTFTSKDQAIRMRDQAARKYHGAFAIFNIEPS